MLTDCLTCQNIDRCDQSDRWDSGCINYKMMPTKNPTNADKIRFMTDEELADWLLSQGCKAHITDEWCKKQRNCRACWLDWLREEAES